MYVCIDCVCMHTYVCMHAWVYEYYSHVCAYMCMCTHAYMSFCPFGNTPQVLKLAGVGSPPPTPILKSLLCLCTGARMLDSIYHDIKILKIVFLV